MQGLVGWLRIAILDGAPGEKKISESLPGSTVPAGTAVCVCVGGEPRLSFTAVQGTGTTCISSLGVVLQACLGYTGTKLAPDIP